MCSWRMSFFDPNGSLRSSTIFHTLLSCHHRDPDGQTSWESGWFSLVWLIKHFLFSPVSRRRRRFINFFPPVAWRYGMHHVNVSLNCEPICMRASFVMDDDDGRMFLSYSWAPFGNRVGSESAQRISFATIHSMTQRVQAKHLRWETKIAKNILE